MHRVWLAATVSSLVACSSTATGTGAPAGESPCVTPNASYVVHLVEKTGGTCGAIPEAVVNSSADGQFHPQPGCAGARTINGCSILLTNYTCTPSNGTTSTVTGEVTLTSDGTKGSGTVQLTLKTPSATCSSSYVVIYTRQ